MMITPVGQRSTHRPQRVQTSSSMTNTTWSSGSTPGWSVLTASAMVSAPSMWMHFHGQMSTQPSHMMHSDWSMWMNCLGLTVLVRSSGAISVSTYSPGKSGIGGLASVLAMTDQFYGIRRANLTDRPPRPVLFRSTPRFPVVNLQRTCRSLGLFRKDGGQQGRIVGKQAAGGQAAQELGPTVVGGEGSLQVLGGLVDLPRGRQHDALPELQLGVVAHGTVGLTEQLGRGRRIAIGHQLLGPVSVSVGAPQPDQAPQLAQRIGVVVDPHVEQHVLPHPAGRFTGDHEQGGRLA